MNQSNKRNKWYDLKEVGNKHREVIKLLMLGVERQEIAAQLNMTPQSVSNISHQPLVMAQLAVLQDARDKEVVETKIALKELEPAAIEALKRSMSEEAPIAVQSRTALSLLTMNGHEAPKKIEHSTGHLTQDQIKAIKALAASRGMLAGAEPVPVLASLVEEAEVVN